MEDGENDDPFLLVPDPVLEYLSSFLWLNDAVNFRRTCKRHAELGKLTVDYKIERKRVSLWLVPDRPPPGFLCWNTKAKTRSLAMNDGLARAFAVEDLEAAEFFWERGADLSYLVYARAIANPTNFRQFVEYPLDRGYQGPLDTIMHSAFKMMDVLLIRRCIWLGARDFDITKYSMVHENWENPKRCSKCKSPGHYKNKCKYVIDL